MGLLVWSASDISLLTFKFSITVGFSQGKPKQGSVYSVVIHTCEIVTDLQQIIFCMSHVLVSTDYLTSCTSSKTSPITFWRTSSSICHSTWHSLSPVRVCELHLALPRAPALSSTVRVSQQAVLSIRGLAPSWHPVTVADLVPLLTETQQKWSEPAWFPYTQKVIRAAGTTSDGF